MSADAIQSLIFEHGIKFIDLRFTDLRGQQQHISIKADAASDPSFFEDGKMFDGSSIRGFKSINESDMVLLPDANRYVIDGFFHEPTLAIFCDVVEPTTMMGYERCPRGIAKRAEEYLKATGIADTVYFGPEPEFFVFDDVRYSNTMQSCFYQVDSDEGAWNSETHFDGGNTGHRPGVKGGYFPLPPVDSSQDLRSQMSLELERMGMEVEAHHHEVATGNQNEIATKFATLVNKADDMQLLKYVVRNVAHAFGKTATFMPKPLVGDNGNGMHCHQSLAKNGENIFAGDGYGGLSDVALYYIGGIIKHARVLNAFTNPTTNSYKRLVPGFEAPVMLAYSCRNRSASIRIPYVTNPKGRRIEVRFPDATANPYLAFAAQLMAGLDGIRNKIHPSEAMDKDLYDLPPEETHDIPTVSDSLATALQALDTGRDFLLQGDVFTNDVIDAYLKVKREEVARYNAMTHPLEFEMYYSD